VKDFDECFALIGISALVNEELLGAVPEVDRAGPTISAHPCEPVQARAPKVALLNAHP
jgi:hypothetical protein